MSKIKEFKEILERFRIKGIWCVPLALLDAGALCYVLLKNKDNLFIEVLVYVISFYSLCNVVVNVVEAVVKIRKWIQGNHKLYQLVSNAEYRMNYSVYVSFAVTLSIAGFKLGMSIFLKSFWLAAVAGYYIVMGAARFVILKNHKRALFMEKSEERYRHEILTFKKCGILMIVFTAALSGAVWQMALQEKQVSYPGTLIYAVAAYTFYFMITAIVNMLKTRKNRNLILKSMRYLGNANALVSMVMLQTAMFASFGGGQKNEGILNGLSGTVVCVLILGMGIYMICNANYSMNRYKSEISGL